MPSTPSSSYFLPTTTPDAELSVVGNMNPSGTFDPNNVDYAVAAQCTTPALPAVTGMQPHGDMNMVFNSYYTGTPRTMPLENTWPGATNIAIGGHAGHHAYHGYGNGNNGTLKLEDVETSHLPSAVPGASFMEPTAGPPQTPAGLPQTPVELPQTPVEPQTTFKLTPIKLAPLKLAPVKLMTVRPPQARNKRAKSPISASGKPAATRRKKRPSRAAGDAKTPEDKVKRCHFLERNRMAAHKCRQRRKEEFEDLQKSHERLVKERESLMAEINYLRRNLAELVDMASTHVKCQDHRLFKWLHDYQMAEHKRALIREQQEREEREQQEREEREKAEKEQKEQKEQKESEQQASDVAPNAQAHNEETNPVFQEYMAPGPAATSSHQDYHASHQDYHASHQDYHAGTPGILQAPAQQLLHHEQMYQQQLYRQHTQLQASSMAAVSAVPPAVTMMQSSYFDQFPAAPMMGQASYGSDNPSPPGLEPSHHRSGSTHSFSSTATDAGSFAYHMSQEMLRTNSNASSASSYRVPLPQLPADFSFTDANKPAPIVGNELYVASDIEEQHDDMFSELYVPPGGHY